MEFFNRFGHFFVSSAYGGGSVEIKCSRDAVESTKMNLAEAKAFLAAKLEGLDEAEENLSADGGTLDSSKSKAQALLQRSSCSWKGGEAALQTKEAIDDKERLQKWKNSLILNPMMLTSELTLESISTAVGLVGDAKKEQATYDALRDILGCEIQISVKKGKKYSWENIWKRILEAITRKESLIEPDHSG